MTSDFSTVVIQLRIYSVSLSTCSVYYSVLCHTFLVRCLSFSPLPAPLLSWSSFFGDVPFPSLPLSIYPFPLHLFCGDIGLIDITTRGMHRYV